MLQNKIKIEYAVFYSILAYFILRLVYKFMIPIDGNTMGSDFFFHVNIGLQYATEGKIHFLSIFHDSIAFLTMAFAFSPSSSAMVTTLLLEIGYAFAIHYWLRKKIPDNSPKGMELFCLSILVFGANLTYFPQFLLYRPIGGLNTWHNPTSYAVKPFVIISFFLFVQMLECAEKEKNSRKQVVFGKQFDRFIITGIFLAVSLLMTAYGKISGLQAFVPACVLYVAGWWAVSRFDKKRFIQCVTIGAAFVPAAVYFFVRYFIYFPPDESGLKVTYIGLFALLTQKVLFTHLWGMSFPLFVVILRHKSLPKNKYLSLSLLTYIISFVQKFTWGIVLPSGELSTAGDPGWALHYAAIILMFASLLEFNNYLTETSVLNNTMAESNLNDILSRIKRFFTGVKTKYAICYIGLVWAALYLISGIFWIYQYFATGTYFY